MLTFDGLLTAGRVEGQNDAATALDAFLNEGIDALRALDGFYNLVLVHDDGRLWALSDPLSARPWYVYRRDGTLALAPTPLAFARWNLPMSLDRLELFHTFRFGHSSYGRTLVREVELLRPGLEISVDKAGDLTVQETFEARYRDDRSLSLGDSAEWVRALMADLVRGTRSHPRLRDLPVWLPLTAGLDSRHLLAELLAQDALPEALQHILFLRKDYEPVVQMAEGLGLPLRCTPVADLDWPTLLRRWAVRSAGLVSVHQSYLLHLAEDAPPGGALGFDGYLMDWLLAVNPWQSLPEGVDAGTHVWGRHYTRGGMLRALFPDASALADESLALFRTRARRFDGPEWAKATLLDLHHRGLHYTGPLDPMMADDKVHVSPGAHRRALEFFLTVPRDVGGDRRARLEAMRRFFPDLATYPDSSGVPYTSYDRLQKFRGNRRQYIAPIVKAVLSGFRLDPAPETAHSRLRQIEVLREVHRRVVERSALVADGHVRGAAVRASWLGLRAGGYQAWTLMALLSADTAYRLLIRGDDFEAVLDDLLGT